MLSSGSGGKVVQIERHPVSFFVRMHPVRLYYVMVESIYDRLRRPTCTHGAPGCDDDISIGFMCSIPNVYWVHTNK